MGSLPHSEIGLRVNVRLGWVQWSRKGGDYRYFFLFISLLFSTLSSWGCMWGQVEYRGSRKDCDHRYVCRQFEVSPGRNKQTHFLMMMPGWARVPKKAESLGGGVRRAESWLVGTQRWPEVSVRRSRHHHHGHNHGHNHGHRHWHP